VGVGVALNNTLAETVDSGHPRANIITKEITVMKNFRNMASSFYFPTSTYGTYKSN